MTSSDGTGSGGRGRGGSLASLAVLAVEDENAFADALVCEAELRWAGGSTARLEDFAAELPQAARLPAARRALLMCEVSRRTREPRDRVREELLQRFPDHRADVDAVIDMAWLMLSAEQETTGSDGRALSVGMQFGNFRLCERLGSGSFGEVWRAWDILLERYIALKILHAAPHDDDRAFLAEAQAAASIEHENVVRVHGAGTLHEGGPRYIDSQLVGDPAPTATDPKAVHVGQSLDRAFARTRPGPLASARIMLAVARGVAAAHARGVLHRDIKPANILLTPSGKPMIADFGLSTVDAPFPAQNSGADPLSSTQAGRVVGTPAYMSPEQAQGQRLTPQSDVYCLGATLRFLLTGSAPYQSQAAHPRGSRWDVLRQVREGSAPPLTGTRGIPPELAAICDRAMLANSARRYLTADKFAEDLDAYLSHRPVSAVRTSALGHTMLWYRRHVGAATVGIIAACAIALSTAIFVRSLKDQRDRAVAAEIQAGVQRDRAIAAQQEVTRQRDDAVTSRQIAEAINQFLAGCIRVAESTESETPPTMKEVVALIEHRVNRTLKANPLVQAGVMETVAVMRDADRYVSAASGLVGKALDINRELLGPDDPRTLRSRQLYATMRSRLGGVNREDCEREVRDVLVLQTRTLGAAHEDTIATSIALASLLLRERAAESEELLLGALRGLETTSAPLPAMKLEALRQLSAAYAYQGRFDRSLEIETQLVTLLRDTMGDRDPETIQRRFIYASVLRSAGNAEQAVSEYLAAARQYDHVLGRLTLESAKARATAGELLLFTLRAPELAIEAVEPIVWDSPTQRAWRDVRVRALAVRGQALLEVGLPKLAMRDLRSSAEVMGRARLGLPGLESRVYTQFDRARRRVPKALETLPGPTDPAAR